MAVVSGRMRLDLREAVKTLQESQRDLSSPEKDINDETFDVRVAELIGGDMRNLDITRISASLFKNGALVAEKGLKRIAKAIIESERIVKLAASSPSSISQASTQEFKEQLNSIDNIVNTTTFIGAKMLEGSMAGSSNIETDVNGKIGEVDAKSRFRYKAEPSDFTINGVRVAAEYSELPDEVKDLVSGISTEVGAGTYATAPVADANVMGLLTTAMTEATAAITAGTTAAAGVAFKAANEFLTKANSLMEDVALNPEDNLSKTDAAAARSFFKKVIEEVKTKTEGTGDWAESAATVQSDDVKAEITAMVGAGAAVVDSDAVAVEAFLAVKDAVAKAQVKINEAESSEPSSSQRAIIKGMNELVTNLMDAVVDGSTIGYSKGDKGDVATVIDTFRDATKTIEVKNEFLFDSEEAIFTFKRGTAPVADTELFKIVAGTDEISVQIGSTSSANKSKIVIDNTKDAAGRAGEFVSGLTQAVLAEKGFFAEVVKGSTGDLAKVRIKRSLESGNQGELGQSSFKISLLDGSADISDNLKSLKVGKAFTDINETMVAQDVSVINKELLLEKISITDSIANLSNKVLSIVSNPNNAPEIKSQVSKDRLSMLSVTQQAGSGEFIFESKGEGVAGFFTITDHSTGKTEMSSYEKEAEVGSLGVSNVSVSGGVEPDALITSVSGRVATTGFQIIENNYLVKDAKIKVGDKEFILKEHPVDNNDIPIRLDDPAQTLVNIANFLNDSKDPSIANYMFEVKSEVGGSNIINNYLRISTKGYTKDFNGVSIEIENPNDPIVPVTMELKDGFANGIDTSRIVNNPDFIGNVTGFNAIFNAPNKLKLSITVGSHRYEGFVENTNVDVDSVVTMQSAQGGSFSLTLAGGQGFSVDSQVEATKFANDMNKVIEQLSFHQQREVVSFSPDVGSLLEFGKSYMTMSKFSDDLKVRDVSVKKASGSSPASIKILTNDNRTFKVRDGDLGSVIDKGQKLELVDEKDSHSKVTIFFSKDIDLNNADQALLLERDFKNAFKTLSNSPMQLNIPGSDPRFLTIENLSINKMFEGVSVDLTDQKSIKNCMELLELYKEKLYRAESEMIQHNKVSSQYIEFATDSISIQGEIKDSYSNRDILDGADEVKENEMLVRIKMMAKQRYENTNMQVLATAAGLA